MFSTVINSREISSAHSRSALGQCMTGQPSLDMILSSRVEHWEQFTIIDCCNAIQHSTCKYVTNTLTSFCTTNHQLNRSLKQLYW